MLTANNTIFSSTAAANGAWRNIGNWTNLSLQINGLESNVWVEVSNDPSVLSNSTTTISAPAAPTLNQWEPTEDIHLVGITTATTYYVKITYVTSPVLASTQALNPPLVGETTGSTESSLLVNSGNLLAVASPVQDTAGYASGWNCYIGTTSGGETIQNLEDGAVIRPLAFGQSFVLSALRNSQIAPPITNTSGTPNSGVNVTGNLVGATPSGLTALGLDQMQIVVNGTQAMINPSGITWNYIRVCKSGGGSILTQAFLFGQNS